MRAINHTRMLVAAALVACASASAAAQEPTGREGLGHLTYRLSCAVCHGAGGSGGAMIGGLAVVPPDLTQLSARNGGTFPTERVRRLIEGGSGVAEHGGQMPAWGLIFLKGLAGTRDPEAGVQQRISDLLAYLRSIQAP